MDSSGLRPNAVVTGPIFPEPVQVITTIPMGNAVKLIGTGLRTNQTYQPVLSPAQLAQLTVTPEQEPFDGDPGLFRLGIEAERLGLAYEFDPYFALSIARVDPVPHQLEAVYDYFLRMRPLRFLLGDDPGAGKTIMAGLLIKELKARGLANRILIVPPANLCFQWQRELLEKFRERFTIVNAAKLRADYGQNPFLDADQVITSMPWVATIEDARESLLRAHWDLVIVDEAHKMAAYAHKDGPKKTYAYRLGEALSARTDNFLMMTATPHKGDPDNFCLFLELLDPDVYADVASLDEAMRRQHAPCYLRRPKEAMVTFPDPDTGEVKRLFTRREVKTIAFEIDPDEYDLYDALTRYVEAQSAKAAAAADARGRALGFTMAMLQRRFASSVYALRRTLERMRDKRQKILDDPEAYRQEQIQKRLEKEYSDHFEELEDEEQERIIAELEGVVADVDPAALREEIAELGKLIGQAQLLEAREVETKLVKLRSVLTDQGVFADQKMKLLLFTEHKDTLDYLVRKLRDWGLTVTQIHGSMKPGDRDHPGTRLYAEREFRESVQVMVATEAAGEGINLQFCWFMVNYDIPWNPSRLEQRMGRIHRYGQEKDCLILNFVSVKTREGRVMDKLLERVRQIEEDLDPDRVGKVFNVLGDVFPANQIERWLREMYATNGTVQPILDRIIAEVDTERFRAITEATLECLATRDLNLSAIIGKREEAKERRLVPEVIAGFFLQAAPVASLKVEEHRQPGHYTVAKVPMKLAVIGERLETERRCGKLGQSYQHIVFGKDQLRAEPTAEWVTPGHPLFEVVREDTRAQAQDHLQRGAVFHDLHADAPYLLDVFSAAVRDGRGQELHRRLFVVETRPDGAKQVRQPTVFLDLSVGKGAAIPSGLAMPDRPVTEQFLVEQALNPFLAEVAQRRLRETQTVAEHLETSLRAIINKENVRLANLHEQLGQANAPSTVQLNIDNALRRIEELNHRLERRRRELAQERQCMIGDIRFLGRALVLPHPQRHAPEIQPMVEDAAVERIAIQAVIAHEVAEGRVVESVEEQNRGFDLISRKPHPADPKTATEVRFIEVKGRAGVGPVLLSRNEYNTAQRLRADYWLYVVFNCAAEPQLHVIRDPANLGWQPVTVVEQFRIGATSILQAENGGN